MDSMMDTYIRTKWAIIMGYYNGILIGCQLTHYDSKMKM